MSEQSETEVSENGYPIREGEHYAKSPLTGTVYLVTRWEDRGDGRIVALQKQEVDPGDVPEGVEFDI